MFTIPLKTTLAAAAALLAPGALLAQSDSGAVTTTADTVLANADVVLRVDGMTCPFCSHGLEKRLRELPALDTVVIRVSDGLVYLRAVEGAALAEDDVRDAVRRAGFSTREFRRVTS